MDQEEKQKRIKALSERMDQLGRQAVCVAFSGGVDSSLLLALACRSGRRHGQPVYAVTFDTALHPACDRETAERVAGELGAVHEVIRVNELELEELLENPPERCYLCKRHLFQALLAYAREKGAKAVLDGTNADDRKAWRPGMRAAEELGVISPLAECKMTKELTRELAASFGISVAARPSTPCMATRLPYGTRLDAGILGRIEAGEAFLREIFEGNVRLRLHGEIARIELDPAQIEKAPARREEICRRLRELGFSYITLDLEGFCSGSMDRGLLEALRGKEVSHGMLRDEGVHHDIVAEASAHHE